LKGIVMAGGAASRFGRKVEKGVLMVGERTLLERAVSALSGPGIDSVAVATTHKTPETSRLAKGLGLEVMTTPGKDYHEDILEILRDHDRFVCLNVDVPFVTSAHVTSMITRSTTRSVAAVVPHELSFVPPEPGSVMIGPDGQMMIWVGLNIVSDDADTGLVVLDEGLLCVNVNDDDSLGMADRIARERGL